MIFYDIDPFAPPCNTPPAPLSETAYQERLEYYNSVIAEYKPRIKKAFSKKKAVKFESDLSGFKDRNAMLDLDFDSWKALLDSIIQIYGHACLLAQIRFTAKKYKPGGWTKEELDEKIDILCLDEDARTDIYSSAGISGTSFNYKGMVSSTATP